MDKLEEFKKRTGITICKDIPLHEEVKKSPISTDNSVYYCELYNRTKKIPGVNLNSWVSVYNLLTSVGIV